MKIALVHDWLTGMRGGERCLEVFCDLFPQADLYTLIHIPGKVSPKIESLRIHTSFLQKIPGIQNRYRYFLPLMPLAIRSWYLKDYDLVLSSSHCVAKGVRVAPGIPHLCYCFTPMRYIWDRFDDYFGPGRSSIPTRWAALMFRSFLQKWDKGSSGQVTQYFAISRYIQNRIRNLYGRESTILYPPVNTDFFHPEPVKSDNFFLMVSAFAPYKRLDLAVEAFNELGYPLLVLGEGQENVSLRKCAQPNIRFLGRLTDSEVRSYYNRCRALIFPGEEDFGITPLESQSMGKPVIAFGKGGVLETVIPDSLTWEPGTRIPKEATAQPTGVFFYEQIPEALISAIKHFETIEDTFEPEFLRNHAKRFDLKQFSYRVKTIVQEVLKK